jgi:hypothetical protein
MNAAEAQTEVAIHLAEAQQRLARAVQACGDYLYLSRIRQQLEEGSAGWWGSPTDPDTPSTPTNPRKAIC